MKTLAQISDERDFELKGRSIECLGHLAVAVGRDVFSPHIMEAMQLMDDDCMQVDDPTVIEYCYGFFSCMAQILEADFAPFLDTLVPITIDAALSREAIDTRVKDGYDVFSSGTVSLGDDAEDDVNEEEELGDQDSEDDDAVPQSGTYMRVRTAYMDLKVAALKSLGAYAQATGVAFFPYVLGGKETREQQQGPLLLSLIN